MRTHQEVIQVIQPRVDTAQNKAEVGLERGMDYY